MLYSSSEGNYLKVPEITEPTMCVFIMRSLYDTDSPVEPFRLSMIVRTGASFLPH